MVVLGHKMRKSRTRAAYATSPVMIDMLTTDMTAINMVICPILRAGLVSSCLRRMALSHVEARARPIAPASMTETSATAFHIRATFAMMILPLAADNV